MRTLKDLIKDLQHEIKQVKVQDRALLTVLGFEIQEQAQKMIGTRQVFWADLKPSTVDRKARAGWGKAGDPGSPLYATGDFERSIEYKVIGRNAVKIFSEAESAKYTEFGTSKMPPRPVFKPAAMIVLRKFLSRGSFSKFYLKSLR